MHGMVPIPMKNRQICHASEELSYIPPLLAFGQLSLLNLLLLEPILKGTLCIFKIYTKVLKAICASNVNASHSLHSHSRSNCLTTSPTCVLSTWVA
jgi:hypothetical protein